MIKWFSTLRSAGPLCVPLFVTCFSGLFANADDVGRPIEMSEIVPKGATELRPSGSFSFSNTLVVEKLSLGELATGNTYFLHLPVFNLSESSISVEKVDSSCGCIAAAHRSKIVEPQKSADILIVIKPQFAAGEFTKLLKIQASNGSVSMVGVAAKFAAPVSVEPTTIKVKGIDRRFKLATSYHGDGSFSKLIACGLSRDFVVVDQKDGYIVVEISEDISKNCDVHGSFATVLQFKERSSGNVLCNIPLDLRSERAFVCKPSDLGFEKNGDHRVANVFVSGRLEDIDFDEIAVETEAGDKVNLTVESRSSRIAKLVLTMDDSTFPQKNTKLIFKGKNSGFVLGIVSSVFKKDED